MNLFSGCPYSLPDLTKVICTELVGKKQYRPVRDVIGLEELPENTVMLRFDVERDLAHHLKLAKQLAKADIPCTMYFHTRKECYYPPTLKQIQATGCEVGYHHECLDRCNGDFAKARELFLRESAMFRRDGLNLQTACPHGEVGLRKNGYRNNVELFHRYPSLMGEAGLRGDAFLKAWQNPPLYASETFRNYNQFWKRITEGAASPRSMMIVAHLHRWRHNPLMSGLQVSQDVLRGLSNKALGKRRYNVAI